MKEEEIKIQLIFYLLISKKDLSMSMSKNRLNNVLTYQ